ncbi:MAG: lipopolysaccharide biosynthesis protein [Vampirovibrionia bacterium]
MSKPNFLLDLKQLFSDSFIYGISGILSKFIGIFLLPIYIRIFSPEEYGILDILSLTGAILLIFVICGLDNALFRFFYDTEDEEERKQIVSSITFLALLISFIVCILLIIFSKQISLFLVNNENYYLLVICVSFLLPSNVLKSFTSSLLRLNFRPIEYTISNVSGLILTIVSSIYLIVILKIGLIGVFLGIILGNSLQIIFNFLYVKHNFTLKLKFSLGSIKEYLNYGIPLLPASIATWGLVYVNRYILFYFSGLSAVGIYSVGYRISSILVLITGAFTMAWSPFAFSILNKPDAKETYARIFKYLLKILFDIAAFITIFSKEILTIIATEDYMDANNLIGILMLSFIGTAAYYVLCIGATIEKKTFDISKALFLGSAINIMIGIVFVPLFGALGAAIAMAIGYLFTCIYMYKFSQKHYFIPYDISRIIYLLIIYLIIYIISIIFDDFLNPVKIIVLFCYYVILFYVIFNDYDKNLIKTCVKSIYYKLKK